MKQRLFLSLLIASTLMVYSLSHLPFQASGLAGAFAWSWFVFCFLVIGGNLYGLVSLKKKPVRMVKVASVSKPQRAKLRG
ncbi:hypothetical protein [Bacillus sp. FJAT-45037]|uniref:hypothetical protein n=1 Tax=Bacillus sp. FJAT-45037 TaxID=2011007 RepID=UPI000C23D1C6|nr:hypothetical protein [Bacillus sp. FJAT-45037]